MNLTNGQKTWWIACLTLIQIVVGWMMVRKGGTSLPGFGIISGIFLAGESIIAVLALRRALPKKKLAFLLLFLAMFAYFIEILSVHTGVPYGLFRYGSGLGPLILGVPIVLPLAWIPLVIGAWALTSGIRSWSVRLFIAVVLLVSFDVVLDPGAVRLGLWEYVSGGFPLDSTDGWYGVPLSNYLGWMLSGVVGVGLLASFVKRTRIAWFAGMPLLLNAGFWLGVTAAMELNGPFFFGIVYLVLLGRMAVRDE